MNLEANTVILARVSSKTQEDEGYSLDSQLKLLEGYCAQRELHVTKIFKIAETASKEQSRKVFHELLAYLRKEKVYHLAVEKTDRLTRNFRDAVAIDEWLDEDKKRMLHAVKENLLLHKEAKSDVKFMWNIHLSVAKKYTDNLREEAMKGWAEKLAQGWLPSPPPPGYKTVTVNSKKIHAPDPRMTLLMRKVFDYYLEPNHSIESTVEYMKSLGITTRMGRPYYKSQVQRILSNPFYIGINRFNGKEYPGAQEPILTKAVFERVQEKMKRKIKGHAFKQHNPVLKNMVVCEMCGRGVTWQLQKGHFYGACQRRLPECKGNKLLRQDLIEERIQVLLDELICPRPELIDWAVQAMKERHKNIVGSNVQLAESIKTQMGRIDRMISNLYDDKLAGEISPERYTLKKQELVEQQQALAGQLSTIDQSSERRLEQKLVLIKLSQHAGTIYRKCSPEQKRLIITKLFENLTYKGGVLSVSYTNFAKVIANNVLKTNEILGGAK